MKMKPALMEALMEAFRLECAKREGIQTLYSYALPEKCLSCHVSLYDNHSDLQRVIDGLNGLEFINYRNQLSLLMLEDGGVHILKATIEQKQLALCAAWGLKGEGE